MILSLVRITPRQDCRQAVEDILLSVAGPTLAEPGCGRCDVVESARDESIFLLEEWESESDLVRHIRSNMYGRVLVAMEFSKAPPDISFFDMRERRGLDLVRDLRTGT